MAGVSHAPNVPSGLANAISVNSSAWADGSLGNA